MPSVALADMLPLGEYCDVMVLDRTMNSIDASNANSILNKSTGNTFGNNYIPLVYGSESYTNFDLTTNGRYSESGSTSTNYNMNTNGSFSDYGSYSGQGYLDGTYANPDNWLGDYLDVDFNSYGNGTYSSSGNYSSGTSGNSSGSYTGSGTGTGAVTGQNQTITHEFYDWSPSGGANLTNFGSEYAIVVKFSVQSTSLPQNSVFYFPFSNIGLTYMDTDGNHGQFTSSNYKVFVSYGPNFAVASLSGGNWVAPRSFNAVYFVMQVTNGPHGIVESIRFPHPFRCYIDLDKTYHIEQMNNDNANTNQISGDISSQTNALKDTTGSDGILSVPKNVGNSIYEQVTFTNQIAGISSQLATTVASADASEGGFTLPSWEFQGQQIWPEMVVSPWTDIPIDIKSKIRLFNTMVFAILWLRSLWNWIASIFGFEHVDDSGGAFDDMFDDDIPNDIQQRYPAAWAKYGSR